MSNDSDSWSKCFHDFDARKMCFDQGKAFIYMDEDPDIIITEEVNGVVDRHKLSTQTIERTWPDGRVERFRDDDPRALECPYIPRQER